MAEIQRNAADRAEAAASPECQPALRPRIYVASLSDYNDGHLHGAWIDAHQSPAELYDDIDQMLDRSPRRDADEWAIHDYDDFAGLYLSEYESLGVVARLGAGLVAHGPAFAAFATWHGHGGASSETFEQHYRGRWESSEQYADDLLRDLGAEEVLVQIPEWLRPYLKLDVTAFARDLEFGGDIYLADASREGGVYVFDTAI